MKRPRATHPHPALLDLVDDLDAADDSPAGSADHSVDEAESSVGADGRMAIVQCMRSVPPSSALLRQGLQ
jgi:hypothetical protein